MTISETHWITAADGIRLCVRIKGRPHDGPPLLYLHGGPGSALNLAAFETWAGPILEAFTPVAYLHQRGVLQSRIPEKAEQSISAHIRDIRTVIAFLSRRFRHRQVDLVGHSWGGLLGFAYLGRHAPTVARFAAIAPVVSLPQIQRDLYSRVARSVLQSGNTSACLELASIGKPSYADIDDFIRLQGLAAEEFGDPYAGIMPAELNAHTGYNIDVNQSLAVQTRIAAAIWPEIYQLDLTALLERLTTPLLAVACGNDSAVPRTSVSRAFEHYGTGFPRVEKRWVLLERSNHLPFTEPSVREVFAGHISEFLRSAGS